MLILNIRGILDPVPAPIGNVSLRIVNRSIVSDGSTESAASSAWSAAASADWANGSPSTTPSSGWSASASSTSQGQWGRPTATEAWASASASVSDWQQSASNGSFPTGTPGSGYGGANSTVVDSTTVTVTGSAPPAISSGSTPGSSGNGSPGHWGAPHYVVYSDYWLHTMPDVSVLTEFNRFILAFWMSDRGAVDNAQMWEWMDAATRQQVSLHLNSTLCLAHPLTI